MGAFLCKVGGSSAVIQGTSRRFASSAESSVGALKAPATRLIPAMLGSWRGIWSGKESRPSGPLSLLRG